MTKEETEEATRAEAYEQNTQENKVTKTSSEQDIKYKTQEAIGLDKAVAEISGDRDTTNTELSAVNEYWGQLKERCIAKPETYEERYDFEDEDHEQVCSSPVPPPPTS